MRAYCVQTKREPRYFVNATSNSQIYDIYIYIFIRRELILATPFTRFDCVVSAVSSVLCVVRAITE